MAAFESMHVAGMGGGALGGVVAVLSLTLLLVVLLLLEESPRACGRVSGGLERQRSRKQTRNSNGADKNTLIIEKHHTSMPSEKHTLA